MNLTVFTKTSHRQLQEGHRGQQSSGHPPCQDLDLYRMHMAWGSPAWCCVHTKPSTKFNGAKAISWLLVIENSKMISVKYVPQPCCLKKRGQCPGHASSPAFTKPLHPILPQFRSSQAKTERECFFEIAQIYVYIYENCNIAFCKESLGQTAQVFGQQLHDTKPRTQGLAPGGAVHHSKAFLPVEQTLYILCSTALAGRVGASQALTSKVDEQHVIASIEGKI